MSGSGGGDSAQVQQERGRVSGSEWSGRQCARERVSEEGYLLPTIARKITCVYGRGGVCVHGKRVGVCIWKESSVHAWGEGGCVHMEGVECACIGRGRECVYM